MRKLSVFVLSIVLLASCTKKDQSVPPKKTIIIKDTTGLNFKVIPLATDRVQLNFIYQGSRKLANVFLKKDNSTLSAFPVAYNSFNMYSSLVDYNFQSDTYKLVIQTTELNDTIYQYTLPAYKHIYSGTFNIQKVLPVTNYLTYDITPSRKYIYLTNDLNNQLTLERLSLQDLKVDTINLSATSYFPLLVRAISDDEILLTSSTYNNHFLQGDSLALFRYNTTTRQSVFVDWISANYGRMSRIINNHILITNPVYSSNTISLINLADNSKTAIFNSFQLDFRYIRETSFDHIFYKNQIIDPLTGYVNNSLNLSDSVSLQYKDDPGQLSFVTQYNYNASTYSGRLLVYHQNNIMYSDDYIVSRDITLPRQLFIENNSICFFQQFGYSNSQIFIDGYYKLDLNTGTTTLVQCDTNPYVINDFQIDAHTIFSIRPDGVYRLTL